MHAGYDRDETDLQALSADIAVRLADLRSDMVRWIVGAFAVNLLGTVGIMVTVAKLVAR